MGISWGGNISQNIKWVVYVDPEEYVSLPLSGKHDVARLIGRLNNRIADKVDSPAMLLGPGRWGSSTPAMGVPVSFSEICNFSVLGEIAFTSGNLMPELSFGSHFFQDLVEADIFYLALYPENKHCFFNYEWLNTKQNRLEGLAPTMASFKKVLKVIKVPEKDLNVMADIVMQKLICFSGKC